MAGSPGIRLATDLPPGPRAALVVATTRYEDLDLRQLRAPAHDARDLAEVLGDPGIGAFTVTPVIDADERHARRAIDVFLSGRGVRDVVVVYLSCHGVLDRRNRLYFAATDTLKNQLSSTGIPAAWLMDQLEECRARQQVLILDCCFSGAFAHGSKGDADLDLERRLAGQGRGQAVLTASRAGEYSFEGQALSGVAVSGSVFTAGLIEGLRTGAADAGGDGYVSVDEAYDYAYRYVQSTGAGQTPQRWLSGGEGAIVLARSPAGIAVTPAALPEDLAASLDSRYPGVRIGAVHELGGWLAGDDPARAATAERTLRQIADRDNPAVVAAARAYLTSLDRPAAQTGETTAGTAAEEDAELPGNGQARVARLLFDAERAAQSATASEQKASALLQIAEAVAAADPARAARLLFDAERAAQSVTAPEHKATALLQIAQMVAASDPNRAVRLLADAERTAQSITDENEKAWALRQTARTVAASDPGRAVRLLIDAERTAQSITDKERKATALVQIAAAVAATDPDHGAHIAQSITGKDNKKWALRRVAQTVAATDPDRAVRLVQSITGKDEKAWALRHIAATVAATDPDHAERIAQSITEKDEKAWALGDVAIAVAAADLSRAERIAQSITDKSKKELTQRTLAAAAAATDPDRAERIAQSITSQGIKAEALSKVATAAADPDRAGRLLAGAEHLTQSETSQYLKNGALGDVAIAMAAIDPDHAERLARSITDYRHDSTLRQVAETVAATDPDHAERIAQSITDPQAKAWALDDVSTAAAATDPDRAERIARSITDPEMRQLALIKVVKAVAPTDPDHAERIAQSITDLQKKVWSLLEIVNATVRPGDVDLARGASSKG